MTHITPDNPAVVIIMSSVLALSALAIFACLKCRFWNTPYQIKAWANPYRGGPASSNR